MITRYQHTDLTWVDCENPTADEVRDLITEFSIDPHVGNELLSPTVRSRVERYDNSTYVILRFPSLTHEEEIEIDFIIGKKFLITTRYNAVDAMHDFSKLFEVDSILDRSNMANHAGFIFYYMMRELYRSLSDQLDVLMSVLHDIETDIFKGRERAMVIEISHINRRLLRFRSSLEYHESILTSYESVSHSIFGEEYDYYSRTITAEYRKVSKALDHMRAYLAELRETNNSLLTTKQNEIVKNLTIMTFVILPLTLVASVFGMNAEHIPLIGDPFDFWKILVIMLALGSCMFIFFKFKKWL